VPHTYTLTLPRTLALALHTRTHARTHARIHARTHARIHARAHTQTLHACPCCARSHAATYETPFSTVLVRRTEGPALEPNQADGGSVTVPTRVGCDSPHPARTHTTHRPELNLSVLLHGATDDRVRHASRLCEAHVCCSRVGRLVLANHASAVPRGMQHTTVRPLRRCNVQHATCRATCNVPRVQHATCLSPSHTNVAPFLTSGGA